MTTAQQTLGLLSRLPSAPRDIRVCTCDGDGWIVTLDRDRYSAPGDAAMVRYTRCVCLDEALTQARAAAARVA
jgi:hypothetical protein